MSQNPFASETIGPEPCLRFLPVMITRLLLSLRKANVPREYAWSLGEPITQSTIGFAEPQGRFSVRDEIPLDTFASTHRTHS